MNKGRRNANAETAAAVSHADRNGRYLGVSRVAIVTLRIAEARAEPPCGGIAFLFLLVAGGLSPCHCRTNQHDRCNGQTHAFSNSAHVHSPINFVTKRNGFGQVAIPSEPVDDQRILVAPIIATATATPAAVVTGDIVTSASASATAAVVTCITV